MKKYFIAAAIVAFSAILFSFINQPEKQKLEYKWFKYRTGEAGIPAPDAYNAKQASHYVLIGDNPYCGGMEGYCGIFAEPSDETSAALPVLSTAEQGEIDVFFANPGSYDGVVVDRKND